MFVEQPLAAQSLLIIYEMFCKNTSQSVTNTFTKDRCPTIVSLLTYGRMSVDRIATKSMSKICILWRLIVVDCDYAESYIQLLSGGNADASHAVYTIPHNS